jgi:glycosyltransferase involved in cell wall biosynthesis
VPAVPRPGAVCASVAAGRGQKLGHFKVIGEKACCPIRGKQCSELDNGTPRIGSGISSGEERDMQAGRNRVLIIAYHFPPDAAVGALRPLKFAKYLPEFGWDPYILTVKPKYYPSLDHSRLREIPSLDRVFRTSMLPHPNTIYKNLKESYYTLIGQKNIYIKKLLKSSSEEHHNSHRTLESVRRFLSSLLWLPPDDILGWLPLAVLEGIRLARVHKIKHIYTTNPPHTTHLVGLLIKKICNVKWIADFRDLWLFMKPFQSGTAERVERWMELKVIENADAVSLTTDWMTSKFRKMYSSVNPEKFTTILNGYDSEDFVSIQSKGKNKKFTIIYVGSFYDERTPEHLLVAISELIAEAKIPADTLEIQFIGNCQHVKGRLTTDIARSLCLLPNVRVIDPVPYKRALQYMMNSHLLLLLAPDQPYEIPAKAFEYLASGIDILALTQDGATADLIRRSGRGVVVDPKDVKQIKEAVLQSYLKWRSVRSENRPRLTDDLRIYERRELTRRLVSILEQ